MLPALSPTSQKSIERTSTQGVGKEQFATMSLHRSLMGSLRANSSYKPTALASLSQESSQPSQLATPSLIAADGTPFQLPEFDRSVNIACSADYDTDRVRIFEQCLQIQTSSACKPRFFALPTSLRLHIYDHCFQLESRKITLSGEFATKAAFGSSFFARPFGVLEDILGGLHSFQALRNELYVYFWTQHHFHITLSHFTAQPFFSPLSRIWVKPYLSIIQFMTVELDLTKFGMGVFLGAADFGNDVEIVEAMFDEIIAGLSEREGRTIMMELNLLCRRYAGFRPPLLPLRVDQPDGFSDLIPYCPELATFICDSLAHMRGYLQHCRMAGFTQQYAEKMLTGVFEDANHKHNWYVETDPAWPARSEIDNPHAVIPHSRIPRHTPPTLSKNKYSYRLRTPRNLIPCNLKRAFSTSTPPTPSARRLRSVRTPQPQTPTPRATAKISPLVSIMIPLMSTFSGSSDCPSPKSVAYSSLSEGRSLPQTPDTPFLPLFGPQTSTTSICPNYNLRLTRSRSFQDDLEEHIRHSSVIMPHEDSTMETGINFHDRHNVQAIQSSSANVTSLSHEVDNDLDIKKTKTSQSTNTSLNDGQIATLPSILESKISHDAAFEIASNRQGTVPRRVSCLSKTASRVSPQTRVITTPEHTKDVLSPLRSWKGTLTSTPSKRSRIPIPSSQSPKPLLRPALSNTQNSPNTMNNLNEQDPAFLRTMRAMRSFSEPTRQTSAIARPISLQPVFGRVERATNTDRPLTSMNVNSTGSHRKKYLTFVSKLRGKFDRESE